MVRLIFGVDLGLSVVEIVDFCHSRQSSGDFESVQVWYGFVASICICAGGYATCCLFGCLAGQNQVSTKEEAELKHLIESRGFCAFRIEGLRIEKKAEMSSERRDDCCSSSSAW